MPVNGFIADIQRFFFFFVRGGHLHRHDIEMSGVNLTVLPPPSPSGEDREYATADDVRAAITHLTSQELSRLQIVAEIHCRHYGVPTGHMEPRDLLHEAFLRSLDLTKKWRKGVSICHHLNRAMENIAGHEVPKLARRFEVAADDSGQSEAEDQDGDPLDKLQKPRNPDATVIAHVTAREDLQRVEQIFNDDPMAFNVLVCRARGQEGKEIQTSLKLSANDYEAISKRIQRKIKSYYEPKSQER